MTTINTAILFPGQGSQEKGMGRSLAESTDQAMDLWVMAEKICRHPLREIFWDGSQNDMSRTEYLQPALTVANLNLWFYFKDNFQVQAMAGHSLGEYCALCAAGTLEVNQTLKLVSLRGRLMAECGGDTDGAMAAILKLDQDTVEQLVTKLQQDSGETIIVANYNTPLQLVVSGRLETVNALEAIVSEHRGRFFRLPVSGAFHSPLMEEAASELAGIMDKIDWRQPRYDIYFNSTAKTEKNTDKIKNLMKKQMTSPVLFTQLISNMSDAGVSRFIESGPKGVLSRMIPQILSARDDISVQGISETQNQKEQAGT